jgi:hypothetical protein
MNISLSENFLALIGPEIRFIRRFPYRDTPFSRKPVTLMVTGTQFSHRKSS